MDDFSSTDGAEVALSVEFLELMKKEAGSLASRAAYMLIGSEELSTEVENASSTLVSMYMSFRSLTMFLEEAQKTGIKKEGRNGEEILVVPSLLFLKITDASSLGMTAYDEIKNVYGLNFTIH